MRMLAMMFMVACGSAARVDGTFSAGGDAVHRFRSGYFTTFQGNPTLTMSTYDDACEVDSWWIGELSNTADEPLGESVLADLRTGLLERTGQDSPALISVFLDDVPLGRPIERQLSNSLIGVHSILEDPYVEVGTSSGMLVGVAQTRVATRGALSVFLTEDEAVGTMQLAFDEPGDSAALNATFRVEECAPLSEI